MPTDVDEAFITEVYEAFVEAFKFVKRTSDVPGREASLMDDLDIDSLDAIDMLVLIGEKFDREIDIQDILSETGEVSTVDQLIRQVAKVCSDE